MKALQGIVSSGLLGKPQRGPARLARVSSGVHNRKQLRMKGFSQPSNSWTSGPGNHTDASSNPLTSPNSDLVDFVGPFQGLCTAPARLCSYPRSFLSFQNTMRYFKILKSVRVRPWSNNICYFLSDGYCVKYHHGPQILYPISS